MNNQSIQDGGDVYPTIEFLNKIPDLNAGKYFQTRGLSLRDHFAGLAMQGFLGSCAHPDVDIERKPDYELMSKRAYELADTMLAARESHRSLKGD